STIKTGTQQPRSLLLEFIRPSGQIGLHLHLAARPTSRHHHSAMRAAAAIFSGAAHHPRREHRRTAPTRATKEESTTPPTAKLPDPPRRRQAFTGELHHRLIHHQPKPSQPRRSPATHHRGPRLHLHHTADHSSAWIRAATSPRTSIAVASTIGQICAQPSTTELDPRRRRQTTHTTSSPPSLHLAGSRQSSPSQVTS
ncbi:hypothetical protein Dimus_022602, partial [Dionaea muscipula]